METKMRTMSLCANFMLPKDIANLNHPLERKGSDETNHLIQVIKIGRKQQQRVTTWNVNF